MRILVFAAVLSRLASLPAQASESTTIGPDFANLVEQVLPTTVYIKVERGESASAGLQQLARDFALPTPRIQDDSSRQTTGSGVIVDSQGFLLTNHHVVDGATGITVTLSDHRTFEAVVIGSDPRTDIAILGIRGEGPFSAATIGDSDLVRPGNWVIAIGHPFDFPFTVTAGIVSARGRRNLATDEIQNYIQTDASVNPGSSGGPLFNALGHLVGINTAIYSPDKQNTASAGISFAIPSNMAMRICNQLISTGRVDYAAIGIVTQDAPASPADPRPGAEVVQVRAGGPADTAGLRRGDTIITVGDEAIPDSRTLRALILAQTVGATLKITIERGSRTKILEIQTAAESSLGSTDTALEPDVVRWAGLTLVPANADRLRARGISMPSDTGPGLLVLSVEPDSASAIAGLIAGDVIVEIFRQRIQGPETLLNVTQGRSSAILTLWRGSTTHLAAVAIQSEPR